MQCIIRNTNSDRIDLVKYQASVTLEKAVDGVSFAVIKKDNPENLDKLFLVLLSQLQDSLNLTKDEHKISTLQALEIAILVSEKYYYLKLEELILIFKNAKLGTYGKIYNRLDIQIICEWIETYLRSEERALYFERLNTVHKNTKVEKLPVNIYENFDPEKYKEKDKRKVDEHLQAIKAEYYREREIKKQEELEKIIDELEKQNENDKGTIDKKSN